MAKNKLHKYERVKQLSNVTFSKHGEPVLPGCAYPWNDKRCDGMKKVVELGCGRGEHTLAFAAADSNRLCVGIDSKSHRICVGAEQAIDRGLENVRFLHGRIERILEFFNPQSIHEIWLTFPDPHLKKRSVKNRLSAPFFLSLYARLLVPGASVHLKTDSDVLYNYTQKSVEGWGGHVAAAVDNIHKNGDSPLGARNIVSSFESKAQLKKVSIKYLAFSLPLKNEKMVAI